MTTNTHQYYAIETNGVKLTLTFNDSSLVIAASGIGHSSMLLIGFVEFKETVQWLISNIKDALNGYEVKSYKHIDNGGYTIEIDAENITFGSSSYTMGSELIIRRHDGNIDLAVSVLEWLENVNHAICADT